MYFPQKKLKTWLRARPATYFVPPPLAESSQLVFTLVQCAEGRRHQPRERKARSKT